MSPRPARCADHGARGAEDTEDGTGAQDRRKSFRCGAARGRVAAEEPQSNGAEGGSGAVLSNTEGADLSPGCSSRQPASDGGAIGARAPLAPPEGAHCVEAAEPAPSASSAAHTTGGVRGARDPGSSGHPRAARGEGNAANAGPGGHGKCEQETGDGREASSDELLGSKEPTEEAFSRWPWSVERMRKDFTWETGEREKGKRAGQKGWTKEGWTNWTCRDFQSSCGVRGKVLRRSEFEGLTHVAFGALVGWTATPFKGARTIHSVWGPHEIQQQLLRGKGATLHGMSMMHWATACLVTRAGGGRRPSKVVPLRHVTQGYLGMTKAFQWQGFEKQLLSSYSADSTV